MMNNIYTLRKCAMELQTTPKEEVVKVAGILSRIKNFFKWLSDSEYRDVVKSFKLTTVSLKDNLKALHKATDELNDAINSGELDTYKDALENVKRLSIEVFNDLHKIKLDSGEISEGLWNYNKSQMKDKEFKIKFQSQLPSDYPIELYKNYNVPFKSLDWFKNITANMIYIKSDDNSALNAFLTRCRVTLARAGEKVDLTDENEIKTLITNFKNAIVNGTFVHAQPFEPSATNISAGAQVEIYVKTEEFDVPGSTLQLTAGVLLIDQRTSHTSDNILSLKRTQFLRVHTPTRASKLHEIVKSALAQHPEKLFENKLTELDLANVMKIGYQNAFGEAPTLEALAFGWAQAALESGRPIVLKNNNIGNLIAPNSWVNKGNPYFTMNHEQVDQSGKTYMVEGQKMMSFRSPEEAATEYWKLLGRKFGHAMPWITGGDPGSAAVALGLSTYYTADIQRYSNSVASLYQTFMKNYASHFQDLKSGAKQLKKLPIKNRKDYSQEEINKIKSSKEESIDDLHHAFASNSLEALVNKRILKDRLPTSKILVSFITDAEKSEQILYAYETAQIIRKFADADVSIHSGDKIELEVSTLGTPYTVCKAVQALCDCMTDQFMKKTGLRVDAAAAYNFNSRYEKINSRELKANLRIGQLKLALNLES